MATHVKFGGSLHVFASGLRSGLTRLVRNHCDAFSWPGVSANLIDLSILILVLRFIDDELSWKLESGQHKIQTALLALGQRPKDLCLQN